MAFRLVDYNGRLAITLGSLPDRERPVLSEQLTVHRTARAADWYLDEWRERFCTGNTIVFQHPVSGRQLVAQTDDGTWEHVTTETPIPRPGRGGRDWEWKWVDGRWQKRWRGAR